VLRRLGKEIPATDLSNCTYTTGHSLIHRRAGQLFGHKLNPGIPFIMVTFDAGFAGNERKVEQLMLAGMNVARINCAHDNPKVWSAMIATIRKAEQATGLPCKVYMDLAGPKIRTEILGKGRKKGRVEFKDTRRFLLAEHGTEFAPGQIVIGCSVPGIVDQLQPGERVLFDDGLFEARVDRVNNGLAMLQMIRISAAKPVLKPEKGINFPDSAIDIPSLTVEDRAHLPFVLKHADIVGYSFVRTPGDVQILEQFINERKATVPAPYLVIKIETPEAVKNLPALLLQGMKQTAFGVMIARGDLAVEIGFERMSEIQEEILWICEAAHVPVIWATQVLETLNKSGLATRSEVTDAAHAAMAECVMVNKGAHTVRVIETLKDILLRSGGHHFKKTYSMRPLSIATRFMAE
jgi:pyruvate kinase